MAENTKIEWCDHTFNPWWGCKKISAGCDHCYAETFAKRTGKSEYFGNGPRMKTKGPWKDLVRWDKAAGKRGVRERVFVGSMCDIGEVNDKVEYWRREALYVLAELKNLDVLLLTKRPANLARVLAENFPDVLPPHFWVGCTVENQQMADERIPHLLQIPASVRFVSVEPMLGPVKIGRWLNSYTPPVTGGWCAIQKVNGIDWVICGGESGGKARPMHPDWVRSLRDQCVTGDTPFLFKQWGEWAPNCECGRMKVCRTTPRPTGARGVMFRCGKHDSGRMIDGREHLAFPVDEAESTTWFARYSKEPQTHGPCTERRYRKRHSDVWFRESELEEINEATR